MLHKKQKQTVRKNLLVLFLGDKKKNTKNTITWRTRTCKDWQCWRSSEFILTASFVLVQPSLRIRPWTVDFSSAYQPGEKRWVAGLWMSWVEKMSLFNAIHDWPTEADYWEGRLAAGRRLCESPLSPLAKFDAMSGVERSNPLDAITMIQCSCYLSRRRGWAPNIAIRRLRSAELPEALSLAACRQYAYFEDARRLL